jgi:hypothetical protein
VINWPDSVIEDIARRRSVLFLGAGISKNATGRGGKRPPTWLEFLEAAIKRCSDPKKHIKKLIGDNDLLTACELIKEKLDEDFTRVLQEEFINPAYSPADIHKNIFKLDSRIVITQNFDKIYDTLAQKESNGTVQVKSHYDEDIAAIARESFRSIIKAHGTIDQPPRMVFTRQQYSEARYRYAPFYAILDALVLTHTFIFLGCSLADPDVRLMLERHAYLYPHSRPHYIVTPREAMHESVRDSTRTNFNVKSLIYNSDNFHKELADSVADLVTRVEDMRVKIAHEQSW